MSTEPQLMFDNLGNPVGVFLPIEEWNKLSEQMYLDIPQWQKDLIDVRLEEYKKDPGNTLDWDVVAHRL